MITDQTARYVPNIAVSQVNTILSDDHKTLGVNITYEFILDGNLDSIQLNFVEQATHVEVPEIASPLTSPNLPTYDIHESIK